MTPYVLLAIDKYGHHRFVCTVEAPTIREAAKKLAGDLSDVRRIGQNDPYRLAFDIGQECGEFTPGDGTYEVLAAAANPAIRDAIRDLEAYYRYGTDNCYKGYLLGQATAVR
ncbi:MAG TPA: hypothetical protein VL500_07940 [Candidatus Eisenbacteria bacterium]|jgi:hypothetical protein|nr:hypothetical protein [Candidatus Eisenbacteria bacterium]